MTLLAVSNALVDKIKASKARMSWDFPWVSAVESRFSRDFSVPFSPEEIKQSQLPYNYCAGASLDKEMPGLSVFSKNQAGEIFHTYGCYARGLEVMNSTSRLLDLVPQGRSEEEFKFPMAWVRHHDSYE